MRFSPSSVLFFSFVVSMYLSSVKVYALTYRLTSSLTHSTNGPKIGKRRLTSSATSAFLNHHLNNNKHNMLKIGSKQYSRLAASLSRSVSGSKIQTTRRAPLFHFSGLYAASTSTMVAPISSSIKSEIGTETSNENEHESGSGSRGNEKPSEFKSKFLTVMNDRGFIHQCTDYESLDDQLYRAENNLPISDDTEKDENKSPKIIRKFATAYLGFDATASSLHVGSLLQIMILRHFQKCGHRPLVLMGGGTTKIGDPSGKDESRKMLTENVIQENIDSIAKVFEKFLTFQDIDRVAENPDSNDAVLVNNDLWLSPIKYLDFLREFGPHFTINRMMNFDSVKNRLAREQPLTFLEFNYMILQAYDFRELSLTYDAILQMGGSDQWGNIVNGVELTRKVDNKNVYGLTAPLITTSDGKKMGKTASGAMWLDGNLLSPYDYWQFWRNVSDEDVVRFLKLFTELPLEMIEKELATLEGADINKAKIILADEATKMLHGEACLKDIHETVENLFKSKGEGNGAISTAGLPRIIITKEDLGSEGKMIADYFVALELTKTKSEARRLIKGGGAKLDGVQIKEETFMLTTDAFDGEKKKEVMLSAGKKKHAMIELQ